MLMEAVIGYALSPRAISLVRRGLAEFCIGGIRSVDSKKIIELAKPVLNFATKAANPLQMINIATSAIGGGYSAYKLNGLDGKMNTVIAHLSSIANAVSRIGTIEMLSWANMGMQLVNVGVSAVGFYLTMQKLSGISSELHSFHEQFLSHVESERMLEYQNHMSGITTQMGHLQERYVTSIFDERDFLNRAYGIERECNETGNFLISVIKLAQSDMIDNQQASRIIFTLAPAYGGLVNEFCSQYRCVTGLQHRSLDSWKNVLVYLNSEPFKKYMVEQMAFNPCYVEVSPEKRHAGLVVAFGSMNQLLETIQVCRDALEEAQPDHLVSPDELINTRAWTALGAQLGIDSDEALTAMFNASLQHAQPVEGEDTVFVPLRAVMV